MISILFAGVGLLVILCCYIIVILGALWVINYELLELTGNDFMKGWVENVFKRTRLYKVLFEEHKDGNK